MSDVEAGGATVFPYLGVKLFPKKVSVIKICHVFLQASSSKQTLFNFI